MLSQTVPKPRFFEILNAEGNSRVFLVCDHASNFVPPELDGLGVPEELLSEHIAWDIGIAELTKALASRWNAPAVLSGFSRLVLDPNRSEDSETLIPTISEHHVIPGNQNLTAEEKGARIGRYHRPYHAALKFTLDNMLCRQGSPHLRPVVICPHSFTPVFNGKQRPWHVSVMWDRDPRLALPLISSFRDAGYVVGNNEPYSAREETGHTLRTLSEPFGLTGAMIEVRQDLIGSVEGIAKWADIVGSAVEAAIADLDSTH